MSRRRSDIRRWRGIRNRAEGLREGDRLARHCGASPLNRRTGANTGGDYHLDTGPEPPFHLAVTAATPTACRRRRSVAATSSSNEGGKIKHGLTESPSKGSGSRTAQFLK
jgi:hypothetical protein